jgi:hypothetical protein
VRFRGGCGFGGGLGAGGVSGSCGVAIAASLAVAGGGSGGGGVAASMKTRRSDGPPVRVWCRILASCKKWRVVMNGFRNFCFLFSGYLRGISSNGGFDLGLGKRISCAWKI